MSGAIGQPSGAERTPASRDRRSGVWQLLLSPQFYLLFQNRLAADGTRRRIARDYIRAKAGDRVLDVGCGPADVLDFLPPVRYTGIDFSEKYIDAARSRYGARSESVRFIQMDVNALGPEQLGQFDLILATGLLHHLSDEQAAALVRTLGRLLAPGGRVITLDGAYLSGQSWMARLLLWADRGRFVRTVEGYLSIVSPVFSHVIPHVHDDLMRLPYTHLIMECSMPVTEHPDAR